jgi:hypothetical protein
MAVHPQRGTKRTCQNAECGVRFYDLTRDPISCPICHSAFVPPPVREISLEGPAKKPRSPFRPSIHPAIVVEAREEESDIGAADGADDAETKIEGEDTVLEIEEDDGDVIVDPLVTESDKG